MQIRTRVLASRKRNHGRHGCIRGRDSRIAGIASERPAENEMGEASGSAEKVTFHFSIGPEGIYFPHAHHSI